MFISVSFSGGVNHKEEVPKEKQVEVATAIADAVKGALESNCANGTGTVVVGETSVSISAQTENSL